MSKMDPKAFEIEYLGTFSDILGDIIWDEQDLEDDVDPNHYNIVLGHKGT
jgi:hypothetical protein